MANKRKEGERNWEHYDEDFPLSIPSQDNALEHNPYPHTQTTFFVHGYEFIIALDGKIEYVGN